MIEFNRIFDGDNVHRTLVVDNIEHRSERRRFARSGRTGDENQPARLVEQFLDNRRQPQLLHRQQFRGDLAQNHAVALALLEYRHTETRPRRMGEGEICAAVVFNLHHLCLS